MAPLKVDQYTVGLEGRDTTRKYARSVKPVEQPPAIISLAHVRSTIPTPAMPAFLSLD